MRHPLRRLEHERESVRHLRCPLRHQLLIRHSVKRVVDLDGAEVRRVKREHLCGRQVGGVKRPLPFLVAVAAGADDEAHYAEITPSPRSSSRAMLRASSAANASAVCWWPAP